MNAFAARRPDAPPVPVPREVKASVIVDVREARRSFDGRVALDGVDLRLGAGEIYALLGPNGAGKTTLIRALCGRLALDGGSVRIDGADPRRSPAARRRLGLVPQSIALYRELTARENLEIFGRLAGVARRDLTGAVDRALGWTGLTSRARDRVARLSGGMQRRLNIAAGTLHDPAVLALDEPTVGVDPGARESIHEILRRLRARGMAILLTTHDLEQAEALADRVGILVDGRVRAEGAVEALVRSTFGGAEELTVVLSDDPGEPGAARLREQGLTPGIDARTWNGALAGGLDALSSLGERLRQAGLGIAEVRVREPGLRGLFFRLTGREPDP